MATSKFILSSKHLYKTLSRLDSIIKRNRMIVPILENMRFVIANNTLTIHTSDLMNHASVTIGIDSRGYTDDFLVNPYPIISLFKYKPEQPIQLEHSGDSLEIKLVSGALILKTEGLDDWPKTLEPHKYMEDLIHKISSPVLLNRLKHVVTHVSSDDLRPAMTTVLLTIGEENKFSLTATDGHMLTEYSTGKDYLKTVYEEIMLPVSTVKLLLANLSEGKVVEVSKNSIFTTIKQEGFCVIIKTTDEKYPDYRTLLDKHFTTTIIIDRVELLREMTALKGLTSPITRQIEFCIEQKTLTVKAKNEDLSIDCVTNIEIERTGPAITLGFNCLYLIKALTNFPGRKIRMNFESFKNACIIEPVDIDIYQRSLLMPVMLQTIH